MGSESKVKAAAEAAINPALLGALSSQISTIGKISLRLPAHLERGWTKTALYLSLLAVLLAGCAPGMNASELQNYQGSFSGVDSLAEGIAPAQMPRVNGKWTDEIVYNSAIGELVAAAQARGVSQEDINLALSSTNIETKLSILSQTPGANAVIEAHPNSDKQHIPATLSMNPSADGVFNVIVGGQECLVGQDICTMPTKFSLNIMVDKTAPTISLRQPNFTNGKLVVGANIDDASSVSNVNANTCGDENGEGKKALGVEGQGNGQYNIIVNQKLGEVVCVEVSAQDSLGNASNPKTLRSSDKYQMSASLANGQDVDSSNIPTGTLNFTPSGSASFGVPVSLSVQACNGGALQGVMENGILTDVIPPVGDLCAVAVASDGMGNVVTSAEVKSQYALGISNPTITQINGDFHAEGSTQTSNGIPALNVIIQNCITNQTVATLPVIPETGGFSGTFTPQNPGDNCVRIAPIDKFQQVGTLSETHGQYILRKPQVSVQFNPKDKSDMSVYLNLPPEISQNSVSVSCDQPQWKKFGVVGHIEGTQLGMDGIDTTGQKWQMEFSCYLPSGDVGSPIIHLNMVDKNGFSYQALYPLDANFTVPLRENPSLWENVAYFGPILAALLLALNAGRKYGPGVFDYINESVRANTIANATSQALQAKDSFLGKPKAERSPRRFADEILAIEGVKSIVNSKAPPRAPEKIKRPRQARTEQFRVQQIGELEKGKIELLIEKTRQYVRDQHFSENANALNARYSHLLSEAAQDINTIYNSHVHQNFENTRQEMLLLFNSKLKEWIFEYIDRGIGLKSIVEVEPKNGLTGDTLQLLLDLQTSSKYEQLWNGIQRADLPLARKLREITICYAVATKVAGKRNHKSAEIMLIDIPHIRRKLLSQLVGEHDLIGKPDEVHESLIIISLGKHKMKKNIDEYRQSSRSLKERIAMIPSFIQLGNIQAAVNLMEEASGAIGEQTDLYKRQIAELIAKRIHARVDSQLDQNRKIDRTSIATLVKQEFAGQSKVLAPYFDSVVAAIENINLRTYIIN